jgi:hypothetical protein
MTRIGVSVAAVLLALAATPASAAALVFSETTTASGSLGGTAFSNALVTLSGTGDTGGVTNPAFGDFFLVGVPVSVSVAGVGKATFTDTFELVSNQNVSAVGLGDASLNAALLFADVANGNYDLTTSFGPVSGPARYNPGAAFGTSAGAFVLDSASAVTYRAAVGGVPEPATWAVMLAGFGALGAVLRSRRHPRCAVLDRDASPEDLQDLRSSLLRVSARRAANSASTSSAATSSPASAAARPIST